MVGKRYQNTGTKNTRRQGATSKTDLNIPSAVGMEDIELPIPNKAFRGKGNRKKGKGAGRPKVMAGSSTHPNSKLTSVVPTTTRNYIAAPDCNSHPAPTGTTASHSVPGSISSTAARTLSSTLQRSSYCSSSNNDTHHSPLIRILRKKISKPVTKTPDVTVTSAPSKVHNIEICDGAPGSSATLHGALRSDPPMVPLSCSVSSMPPPPKCPPVVSQVDYILTECPPHAESAPVFTDQTEAQVATNLKQANSIVTREEEITIVKNPLTRMGTPSSRGKNSLGGSPDKRMGRSVGSKKKIKPSSVGGKKKRGQKVRKKKKIELSKAPKTPNKFNKKVKTFNGPYIHIVGNKDNPSSIEVINVAQKEEKMNKVQQKQNFNNTANRIKKKPVGHHSTHYNDAFDRNKVWLCVFCHKGSHIDGLGDLFGPYYIKDKNPESTKSSAVTPSTSSRSTREKRRNLETSEDSKRSKRAKYSAILESTTQSSSIPNDSCVDPDTADMYEVWVHEDCAVWCQNILRMGEEVQGLEEAIVEAKKNLCYQCSRHGATLSCRGRGCKQQYHFSCAKETGCQLDIEKFFILCPTHHARNFYNDNQARSTISIKSCGM